MTNTNTAANTVKTLAIVGFGRSGKRLPAGSRSARTFRLELTWTSGYVAFAAPEFTSLFAAAGFGARVYNAAESVGLV